MLTIDTIINEAIFSLGDIDEAYSTLGFEHRDRLVELISSLNSEADLNPTGEFAAQTLLSSGLDVLPSMHVDRSRFPSIAEEQIVTPVFIVGLPRTGSSILHRALSCERSFRAPLAWEVRSPSPIFPFDVNAMQSRRRQCASFFSIANELDTDLQAKHELNPDFPEECVLFSGRAQFHSWFYACFGYVPTYVESLVERSMTKSYAEHKVVLKHLQWASDGSPTWLLKSPFHLFHLEDLVNSYPDARLIWLHRDPIDVLPSWCSLATSVCAISSGMDASSELGDLWCKTWAIGIDRALSARRRIRCPVLDVTLFGPSNRLENVVANILNWLEVPESTRTSELIAKIRSQRFREHVYSLESFHLTEDLIHEQYGSYYRQFGELLGS